jgi:hypothetical protein
MYSQSEDAAMCFGVRMRKSVVSGLRSAGVC